MNVFVIPSWYRHRCFPLEGSFLLDQVMALGELRAEWKIANSLWGQGVGRLSLAHALRSPRCLIDALAPGAPWERAPRENVLEIYSPAVTWNERILKGNRGAVLAANRRNLERAIRRFGPIDLIHAHVSYPAGWVAMKLKQERGIPYVITEHMGPFPLEVYERHDGSLEPWIRTPLERADARIAVSPALSARIASFGLPAPDYVPNVIDEREYSVEPRPARDGFVFFTLCSMEPVKGIPDLLKAIRLLIDRLPEGERGGIAFRLGGDGPNRREYQDECHGLGLDPWVTWLGFLPRAQARREFQECDAYVLASRYESFGVVLAEALASGRPLIATRCGGPETIVTPENGLLVPVGRPDELAGALHAMLREAGRYDPRVLREDFMRRFSRPAVVERIEEIYRRAIAGQGQTR